MKKHGFTLAETLITLVIIGVVAALTVPTIISKYQEQAQITKLKKAYSQLSNAFNLAVIKKGSPTNWFSNDDNINKENSNQKIANAFIPFLKIKENCLGMTTSEVMLKCHFKTFDDANPTNHSYIILEDGTRVGFRLWHNKCKNNKFLYNGACGDILINTEPTKTVKKGYNNFGFFLGENGLVPYGTATGTLLKFEKACNTKETNPYPLFSSGNMYGCTAWVLYKGNMDYWRCTDLSWNGKNKCSK